VAGAALIALLATPSSASGQTASEALKQAEAAYHAGQEAYARNDLAAAQADFERVVKLTPRAEAGHSSLGVVLLARGHTNEAIRELEAALAIKKTDRIAETNLAVAYQKANQPAKAVALFSDLEADAKLRKQALPPDVVAAYVRALAATGRLSQAGIEVKGLIHADPRNAGLHDELGSIDAQQKEWTAARQEFAMAIQLSPELAMAHLHLGLAMQAEGEPKAVDELIEAQRLAPDNPVIELELGKAFAAAGQDDQAIPLLQRALDGNPESPDAMYPLALALQRTNRVPEAIPLLRRVVASQPANAGALTNLGMALCQAQRAKEAVPVLQRAVVLTPKDVTAHQDLAAAYVQLSQFGDAVTELHTALSLAPSSAQLHYNLGVALKMQDDAAGAIPELEAAERLDPAAPEPAYLLGVLYMQAARYEEAARELKTSLTLRPANGDGWATLGSVYSKLDRLPEASAALHEAIRQLPDQPDPHLTLAAVLTKQSQPAEAASERRQAAELMRKNMNHQRAEVATNAGNSLLKSGDLAGADVQFRDALTYDANYAEAHLGLAKLLDLQGKAAEAAAERQRAEVSSKPASP
jgi:tetratricopeptide (TPR) repeat protein